MVVTVEGTGAQFDDDELLPISALQHLLFCERQAALIHVESLWAENRLTVEGRKLHERVDTPGLERRPGTRVARGLHIASREWGITGRADVVEYARSGSITPVEYKRGRPKKSEMDRVQLCAQAFCLEEMHRTRVERGALYYWRLRRRVEVDLNEELRRRTGDAIARIRWLVTNGVTPPAILEKKCARCSLRNLCLPGAGSGEKSAKLWFRRAMRAALEREDGVSP